MPNQSKRQLRPACIFKKRSVAARTATKTMPIHWQVITFSSRVSDEPAPSEPEPPEVSAPPKTARPPKRYRPPGPPFHEKFHAQNGRVMRIRLEVPQEGEECPLTLSPIAEDALEFLRPETTYFAAFPTVKKMVLPCGHGFGALQCLYHFTRRNMLCPCCRQGVDSRLALFCVPTHMRSALSHKVSEELRRDDREVVEENARAAAMVQLGNQPSQIFVFVPSQRLQYLQSAVTMAVDFHTEGENRPRASMIVPLAPNLNSQLAVAFPRGRGNPQISFEIPTGQILRLLEEQLADPTVHSVNLRTLMDERYVPDMASVVGSTGEILLGREASSTIREIQAGGGSYYRIVTEEGDSRIRSWEWVMPEDFIYLPIE